MKGYSRNSSRLLFSPIFSSRRTVAPMWYVPNRMVVVRMSSVVDELRIFCRG
jgi:hypothetical protein